MLALWFGWIVTEVGRQPWIVQGLMRTEDAVTDAGGIWFAFAGTIVLYTGLGILAVKAVRLLAKPGEEGAVPYGPDQPEGPDDRDGPEAGADSPTPAGTGTEVAE